MKPGYSWVLTQSLTLLDINNPSHVHCRRITRNKNGAKSMRIYNYVVEINDMLLRAVLLS